MPIPSGMTVYGKVNLVLCPGFDRMIYRKELSEDESKRERV